MALTPTDWSHYVTIPESYIPASSTTGQTLVITEATISKLSTGDQTTFWSNVLNGGGDVRICTDAGGVNQLPVQIISLDNIGRTCVIFTRKATYAGTGDLFLFIGKAGETQPLAGAAFGSEAVWADSKYVLHLNEAPSTTADNYKNATGLASSDGKARVTPSASVPNVFGMNALKLSGVSNEVDFGNPVTTGMADVSTLVSGWAKVDTLASDSRMCCFANGRDGALIWMDAGGTGDGWAANGGTGEGGVGENDNNATLNWQHIAVWNNGTTLQIYVDGVPTSSGSSGTLDYTFSRSFRLGRIWDLSSFYDGAMSHVKVTQADKRDNIPVEYENQKNQSTFFGTPTITAIVGGGGVTGNGAFSLAALTASGSAAATLPQPSADGAFSFPLLTVSSSGTATLPQPLANGAFSLPVLNVSASAIVTLPQPIATGAFSLPILNVAGVVDVGLPQPIANGAFNLPVLSVDSSATATLPQPIANGSFTLPLLSVAGTGEATLIGNVATGAFSMPVLNVIGSGNVTLPQPIVNGAFSLPVLSVIGSGSSLLPTPVINGNITLPKLTVNAAGSVTLPQPIAVCAFSLPVPVVKGFATISGLQLIIDPKTNINQVNLSANINQSNLSNNINFN